MGLLDSLTTASEDKLWKAGILAGFVICDILTRPYIVDLLSPSLGVTTTAPRSSACNLCSPGTLCHSNFFTGDLIGLESFTWNSNSYQHIPAQPRQPCCGGWHSLQQSAVVVACRAVF
ncbi:hypothetical protein BDV06DRAFT_78343 [Aspergillus oleicola]